MTGRIGIAYNGYELTIEHFPGRKKPCLAVRRPGENKIYKVASFNSEATADVFIEDMRKMCGDK